MKTIIDKQFNWEAGHRVWSQELDKKYTSRGDTCTACRYPHGHSYRMKVFLEEIVPGMNIQNTGMVTDFKHLGFVKDFIDDVLDHKTLLDINDPLNAESLIWLLDDDENIDFDLLHKMPEGYWIADLTRIIKTMEKFNSDIDSPKNKAILEKYQGVVLVDFIPTSENIANWLLEIIQEKLKDLENVRVKAVELWETPKSHVRAEA